MQEFNVEELCPNFARIILFNEDPTSPLYWRPIST